LALLVARVLADDADHIVAAHDLAGFAKAFDGGSDFHAEDGWIREIGNELGSSAVSVICLD
jgi:hypothetical protein